ncbi:hypothetical protein BXZ70DRAFT_77636 [Cristinia sonorae]|uniref:Uncharacterized protein n=1 Tax=Cristinia sonorae TaxID=1940300 RepID=A0A8K0USU0_9AGAR|nr:hypothetical protein BXZ70DRAFT_77636 [Cristinia sonorae]
MKSQRDMTSCWSSLWTTSLTDIICKVGVHSMLPVWYQQLYASENRFRNQQSTSTTARQIRRFSRRVSSGANSKRQWILLRDFVAKEIIANGLNKQQIRVMGMYILYDRDGVWSIFITSPVDGVFGLTRLMDFFAEDLEKHMNAETFFRPDTKMERYAERKFNKQQSAAKEKEKPFKRDPDEQKKPKPWKDPIIGGGTGGITIQ